MASLSSLAVTVSKTFRPVLMRYPQCSFVAVRKGGYWNRDWKPGPYPKTAEERAAAAKKYGLRVEDYEPYPDDGTGFGDYPKLPLVSAAARNPYEVYDMPEFKRNFNEPMHVDFDAVLESKWCPDIKPLYPYWKMLLFLFVFFGSWTGLVLLGEKYRMLNPTMAKQYPHKGKVHYTFDLADD